jgi:hypothetical protein
MPAPDFQIHQNQLPCATSAEGISVRTDVLATDEKGENKSSVQKHTTKILRKLGPILQSILLPNELVLYALRARSPLSLVEQFTAAWWTRALAACAIIVTNTRILFFPIKTDGSWRESVLAVQWGDVEEIRVNGFLTLQARFRFKNRTTATYTALRRVDAKKLAAIAAALIPVASGEQTARHGPAHLCPDCREALEDGQYFCENCRLTFKDEKTMILRSVFLPAGGYFYTGHPLIAILPAIVEIIFVFNLLLALYGGLTSHRRPTEFLGVLLILVAFWAIETAITILHCRRYIRDFIPDRRNASRVHAGAVPKLGD